MMISTLSLAAIPEWLIIAVAALIFLLMLGVAIIVVAGKFYVKVGPDEAIVRTGMGGIVVVIDGGTLVYPVVQPLEDPALDSASDLWDHALPSESPQLYRGEFLAYVLSRQLRDPRANIGMTSESYLKLDLEARTKWIREAMLSRYSEGYSRGVHDHDAALILTTLLEMERDFGLLAFPPRLRSEAWFVWSFIIPDDDRKANKQWVQACITIERLLPKSRSDDECEKRVQSVLRKVDLDAWPSLKNPLASKFMVAQHKANEVALTPRASKIFQRLSEHFPKAEGTELRDSLLAYRQQPEKAWHLGLEIVSAYLAEIPSTPESALDANENYREEVARLFIENCFSDVDASKTKRAESPLKASSTHPIEFARRLEGLVGDHPRIVQQSLVVHYHEFGRRLRQYTKRTLPRLQQLQTTKRKLLYQANQRLRIHEFKARVLTSFVRNQLIDQVYLPRIGDNLAKQIGAVGDHKRTDRSGLLLLVSPPGYGKTTLM